MGKDKKNEDKLDVFKDAQEEFVKNMVTEAVDNDLSEETEEVLLAKVMNKQEELALLHAEEGDKWDNLSKYIAGDGAERFMNELKNAPGKDFIRNYLKVLEHFKPKIVRSDIAPEDEVDRSINVQIVQILDDGSTRTVGIDGKVVEPEKDEEDGEH